MVACLCCSSLLIGASNPVTNPEEGHFALVCRSFAFHDSQASFANKLFCIALVLSENLFLNSLKSHFIKETTICMKSTE